VICNKSPNIHNLVSCINPRAKRLSLRVDQCEGVIRLTIPKWTLKGKIDRFLKANENWIIEKSALLLPKIDIKHGAMLLLKGIEHEIIIQHHSKRTTDIHTDGAKIIIKTSRDDPSANLKRWMIEQCRQTIEPLCHSKSEIIRKPVSKIDLRDTKSRWGSCSTDKRLMFSWRLLMAPPAVLDYVVAHEVAHLKHMDHSNKFWNVCYDLTDGDAKNARQWLRDNGNQLMRWF